MASDEALPDWRDFASEEDKERNPFDEFTLVELMNTNPNAKEPAYATSGSAGLDLYAAESGVVPRGKSLVVSTGVIVGFQPGHFGTICPRSGLFKKHMVQAFNGTIDNDYQGEIKVMLMNLGETDFSFLIGTAIAQLVIQKYEKVTTKIVSNVAEVRGATRRGANGFGSTDPKKV